MIIVTGAAGFIGSNLLKGLNKMSLTNIIAVDDLTNGRKFQNLAVAKYADYLDYEDFLSRVIAGQAFAHSIEAVFHEGSCSITTEWNGRYMIRNHYEYSKHLLYFCTKRKIPFIYASSAAVYGNNHQFEETSDNEIPLNVYGYSRWIFDQYYLQQRKQINSQVVGLRYFNVYGPHEQHKGSMASMAFHLMNQLRETGIVKLFKGSHGYSDGEQLRDFVSIEDVIKINLWFMGNPDKSGIFNVGTGKARTFNTLANILIRLNTRGKIEYIPFPEKLKGTYQSFTQANIAKLRNSGYSEEFLTLEKGLRHYFDWMSLMKKETTLCESNSIF
ncbi:ADP-glyceromanno-heptose 6-epimerase [Coxiella endosymbiont of Amblyomma nuttalli]|uniref:ADP-glyceromanno-heptose 6-epimerase n=1 Tax=Coxiella endosymbiont of Amblyomma nuttalli TaxID=2749996 RepID=UPI001BA7E245|nr:ADP-glyceromanno-heptose 6-epimerase [Coxiella endosymbiont of Amblyomma nuttalli]QTS84197.1 ADP-L-glycero-D-manno-heptose-6-epimerase [Coxiella endosymbiont of Amblyomma nuttalli]